MTRYQNLESILNQYKFIKVQINNLKIELKNAELDGIGAIDYSRDKLSNSYKISSIVENLAFTENKEKEMIEKELQYLEYLKEKTDNALELLNSRDKKIIELRYIEKVPNIEIARRYYLSESSVRKIRKEAISKMKKLFQ